MSEWTAIIVNYNGALFLDACLIAVSNVRHKPRDVIVIDNASTDDSLLELNGYPWADTIPLLENRGYAGGANAGLGQVETEIAVILNPDVELAADFGDRLIEVFDNQPTLGAAGALLLYPDEKTIQHAGGVIDSPLMLTDHLGRGEALSPEFEVAREVDFVTGAAFALRMDAVWQVEGFDEALFPAYYEDVDLCWRLRDRGWSIRFEPALRALHHEGATLSHSVDYFIYLHRNRLRFALKHLTSNEWTNEFVPAEYERLRDELVQDRGNRWASLSGGAAIDEISRQGSLGDISGSPFDTTPLSFDRDDLSALKDSRSVGGEMPGSRIPGLTWLRTRINNLGPRWYIDSALARQCEFNDAIVRVLEAQDRQNREQTARLLMHLLLTLELLRRSEADEISDDWDADIPPEIDLPGPEHTR